MLKFIEACKRLVLKYIFNRKYIRNGKCNMCGACCEKIYVRHIKSVIKDEEEFKKLRFLHPFYNIWKLSIKMIQVLFSSVIILIQSSKFVKFIKIDQVYADVILQNKFFQWVLLYLITVAIILHLLINLQMCQKKKEKIIRTRINN